MNFRTLLGFQFGCGDAIDAVARSRASFFTGMVLVLLTGIPRNYDQIYFRETPFWLIGPLVFSLFSGTFVFAALYFGFIRRRFEAPQNVSFGSQWRCFISLFWMTAPIAWLYAIPVERFLDSYHAAETNLTLLSIVSLWRVLLMSRVVSRLQQIHFARALLWVLTPACLEVLVVIIVGVIFSPAFSRHILAAMSGMRNSPEEILVLNALGYIWWGALIVLVVVMILVARFHLSKIVQPFPAIVESPVPVVTLLTLTVAWIAVAIPAQREQYRFVTHAKMVESGKYRESLDYLEHFTRRDFPASRRISPDPYDYKSWEQLPGVVAALKPTDPEWIRRLYLDHLGVLFSHYWLMCSPAEVAKMFAALERLPEAKDWLERHQDQFYKISEPSFRRSENDDEVNFQKVTNILQHFGIVIEDINERRYSTNFPAK